MNKRQKWLDKLTDEQIIYCLKHNVPYYLGGNEYTDGSFRFRFFPDKLTLERRTNGVWGTRMEWGKNNR
jgi:hypothetical protein